MSPLRRTADRVRVLLDGGGQPRWRGDGRELFYATPTGPPMALAVRVAVDRPEVSLPVELFEVQGMRPSGEFDDYAASRDGQRFLVKVPVERASTLKLHVVTELDVAALGRGRHRPHDPRSESGRRRILPLTTLTPLYSSGHRPEGLPLIGQDARERPRRIEHERNVSMTRTS